MEGVELQTTFHNLANEILIWVGFGTLVGLAAKAVMPGRDPGGAVATLAMGIGGAVIGCGTLAFFWEGQRVSPLSPIGMLVATGLFGYFISEEAPVKLPGAPFFFGTIIIILGALLAIRSFRKGAPSPG